MTEFEEPKPGDIIKFAITDFPSGKIIGWEPSGRALCWEQRERSFLSVGIPPFIRTVLLVDCGDILNPREVEQYTAERSKYGWLVKTFRHYTREEFQEHVARLANINAAAPKRRPSLEARVSELEARVGTGAEP